MLLSCWNILVSVLCFFFGLCVYVCVRVFTIEDKKSKDQDMETWMGSSGPLLQTLRMHKHKVWGLEQTCAAAL